MASSPPSDAGLVHSALGGDAAGFSALLDRYRASLYARALAYPGQPEDAADAVQGREQIRAMCEQDLDDGTGTRLVDVVSSAAITVIESTFVNPDPQHCPPAVTQVLFHDGTDQVRRALGYFQLYPAPKPE